ncbi:hypothetical protein CC80DRAFT_91864 [Byssothecium circinans]|uniref:Uncharacterized protein n=1 Tax=Byssothecium circinans TaxID=147558 RepID=A0A6A5TTL3_9PLEO|nr:hypothetical protein CC80DRAFT_91864 [Byssothecium circinans]
MHLSVLVEVASSSVLDMSSRFHDIILAQSMAAFDTAGFLAMRFFEGLVQVFGVAAGYVCVGVNYNKHIQMFIQMPFR